MQIIKSFFNFLVLHILILCQIYCMLNSQVLQVIIHFKLVFRFISINLFFNIDGILINLFTLKRIMKKNSNTIQYVLRPRTVMVTLNQHDIFITCIFIIQSLGMFGKYKWIPFSCDKKCRNKSRLAVIYGFELVDVKLSLWFNLFNKRTVLLIIAKAGVSKKLGSLTFLL